MKQSIKNVYFISALLVIVDQFIKAVVSYKMKLYDTFTLIIGFLDINLVHNDGAAFNFLEGGRFLFIAIAVAVILLMTAYIYNNEFMDSKKEFIYALILGGIIGNLIDRIVRGYVIDYISFTIAGYKFPVFNFADICIVVGVIVAAAITIKEDLWK